MTNFTSLRIENLKLSNKVYDFCFQTVQLIDQTDADVKIFAGDVNALPFPGIINGKRQPYSLLTSILTDSLVDRYVNLKYRVLNNYCH